MNRILKTAGLFARQGTTDKIRKFISAMRRRLSRSMFLVSAIAVAFALLSCDKETQGQTARNTEKERIQVAPDSLKPKVNVQVNRHYDDKGNMIGFDSTYSAFYSNMTGDTASMDSLMRNFDRFFSRNSFFDRQFDPLFFSDSLRYPDFFHNDFFMKRYELNDQYLRESMKRMDSIKNKYFKDHSKKWRDSGDL